MAIAAAVCGDAHQQPGRLPSGAPEVHEGDEGELDGPSDAVLHMRARGLRRRLDRSDLLGLALVVQQCLLLLPTGLLDLMQIVEPWSLRATDGYDAFVRSVVSMLERQAARSHT